jgi:integrase
MCWGMEAMMAKTCPLSDTQVRSLKPAVKPYRVFDGDGLYIEVFPNGSKLWRVKKIVNGKDIRRSLGKYPAVSLKDAREKRGAFETVLTKGETSVPTLTHKILTFNDLFNEWRAKNTSHFAEGTLKSFNLRVSKYLLPALGYLPLSKITPQVILNNLLKPIETLNHLETASKIKSICSQVLRYGIILGLVDRDFTQDLNGYLPSPNVRHMPTITDPPGVTKLIKGIFAYKGHVSVIYALRLLPYLFVRPGELRAALWAEINWEEKLWRIPAEKMKMKRPHLVPLAAPVLAMLKDLKQFTGNGALLFPGSRSKDRPISDVTLLAALLNLGYKRGEIVPHGFRSMASTLLNEQGYNADWIERQLAHVPGGVRAVYNYAQYLPERRKMMEDWANYLDKLRGS